MTYSASSFDWISESGLVPVCGFKTGNIYGYLGQGYPLKPGNLHMQYPCTACKERQDLAVCPIGQRKFIVDASEFYDMSKKVVRDGWGSLYDHRENAVSRSLFRFPHYQAMKDFPFSFIHECTACACRFDVAIRWSEEHGGFQLRMWRTLEPNLTRNPDFEKIDMVETWTFVGDPAITRKYDKQWGEEKKTFGVTRSGRAKVSRPDVSTK
jgi:hypothetical protein